MYIIKKIMTIRKFLLQSSFIFALIIGFTAYEDGVVIDYPLDDIGVEFPTQNNNLIQATDDCYELFESQLEIDGDFTLQELLDLGLLTIDCDNVEWDGEDTWDDIDWSLSCEELVATYPEQLEALGVDLDDFCPSSFPSDEYEDVELNCGSVVCCAVHTSCEVRFYSEVVIAYEENGQTSVYNANNELVDTIPCTGSIYIQCGV